MNPFFLRRVASTRLFCLLACLPVLSAWAQDSATPAGLSAPASPDATPAPAEGVDAEDNGEETTSPPRFGIQLETEEALRAFILRHIDLQRFRTLADLDSSELDRLLLAAPDNLRDLLGTQGYFSPTIAVTRVAAKTGDKEAAPPLGDVRIRIDAGPATQVATSNVYFSGDIQNADSAKAQREAIERSSAKAVGAPFTQSRWDQLKSESLRQLTAERYPRGRIANSLSDIDATRQEAHWYVELDSGQPVQVGEVRVEGAERYDTATAERLVHLAGLHPGADYSLSKLQDAQQKISDSGYYSSVFAYVDLDQDGAERDTAAPVVVQVKENLPQKVTVGVGGSTNNGPRLSLEHSHLRLPLIGWRASSKLQWEDNDQLLSSDWNAPIEEDGWHWLSSAKLAKQLDDDTTTTSMRLSAGKSQENADMDRRYFLQYDRSRTVNATSELASSDGFETALSLNYGWTWRRFDNVPFPDRGYGLGVTLGLGSTLGTERYPFISTQARWLGYWPLGGVVREDLLAGLTRGEDRPADTRSRNGRLALRLQGGAVVANSAANIPDTLLFLTGGDNTVRGYGLRDIGVEASDGTVSAGRYLAVASFEWQRPIWSDGVRTDWESVVFADAGAVADDPADLEAKVGVGAGVRYNSPVGPLQLDLAYGLDAKRFRIHLNVGFSF